MRGSGGKEREAGDLRFVVWMSMGDGVYQKGPVCPGEGLLVGQLGRMVGWVRCVGCIVVGRGCGGEGRVGRVGEGRVARNLLNHDALGWDQVRGGQVCLVGGQQVCSKTRSRGREG